MLELLVSGIVPVVCLFDMGPMLVGRLVGGMLVSWGRDYIS